MESIIEYLSSTVIYENTLLNLIIAICVLFGTIIFRYFLKLLIFSYLKGYVEATATKIDDIVLKSLNNFVNIGFWVLALYLAKFFIFLPEGLDLFVNKGLKISLIIIFFYLLKLLSGDLIDYYFKKTSKKTGKYFSSLVKNVSNIVVLGIGISILLSELGYDITTLVAGLGISGIAVALAIQPILASIFASFFIFIDKPFKVGDSITIGSYTGKVKEIGLYSTRITTLNGTEAVISNTEMTKSEIENISQRKAVRIDMMLGVVYEISTEKLRKSMGFVRDIIEKKGKTTDDVRVYFKEFGDFSLNLSITYFIDESDYHKRLAIQSDINLEIKEKMEKEGVDFAYPTAVHYIKN